MITGKLILVPAGLGAEDNRVFLPDETLREVFALNHFVAERAKTARAYLKSIGFPKPMSEIEVIELDKHGQEDYNRLLAPCLSGLNCGLISEAGAPSVADPGGGLVAAAHANGIEVVPLIGPSSILLALMASGMNGQRFSFHGYLAKEERELVKQLKNLESESATNSVTQIFIETPFRNEKLKDKMLQVLNAQSRVCFATNLTTPDEKIISISVSEARKKKINIDRKPTVFLIYAGKEVK